MNPTSASATLHHWFPDIKVRKIYAFLESDRVVFAAVPNGAFY